MENCNSEGKKERFKKAFVGSEPIFGGVDCLKLLKLFTPPLIRIGQTHHDKWVMITFYFLELQTRHYHLLHIFCFVWQNTSWKKMRCLGSAARRKLFREQYSPVWRKMPRNYLWKFSQYDYSNKMLILSYYIVQNVWVNLRTIFWSTAALNLKANVFSSDVTLWLNWRNWATILCHHDEDERKMF